MGIELVFLSAAILAVLVFRGSYSQLLKTKVNHWWTLVLVLAGNIAIEYLPLSRDQYDTIGLGLLLATYVLLIGFCIANLQLKGMWIAMTGIGLNALVIALNQGMPVTSSGGYFVEETIKHQVAQSGDLLPWLGDVIPLNFASIAISIGDILFFVGITLVIVAASRVQSQVDVSEEPDLEDERDYEPELTIDLVMEENAELPELNTEMQGQDKVHLKSSHGPRSKSKKGQKEKAEKLAQRRKHKKWQKKHGLAALPSKEDLGFDEESMEIVDAAK